MCTQPKCVRPFLQVTSLSPTYRYSRHRRPLIADRLSCCPCLRVFTAPYPSAIHGYSSPAGPSCSVFLCIEPRPASTLHVPRVALAGSLVGTETARNTPRPPAHARLLPERCAQCSLSCLRLAIMFTLSLLGAAPECPRATFSPLFWQFGARRGYCALISPMYSNVTSR